MKMEHSQPYPTITTDLLINEYEAILNKSSKREAENPNDTYRDRTQELVSPSSDILLIQQGWQCGAKVTVNTMAKSLHANESYASIDDALYQAPFETHESEERLMDTITTKISNLNTYSDKGDRQYRKSPPKYEEAIAYLTKNKIGTIEGAHIMESETSDSTSQNSTSSPIFLQSGYSAFQNPNESYGNESYEPKSFTSESNPFRTYNSELYKQESYNSESYKLESYNRESYKTETYSPIPFSNKGSISKRDIDQLESFESRSESEINQMIQNEASICRPKIKSLKNTIGKSYSLDEGERLHNRRKAMKGKKASSFEVTAYESGQNYSPNHCLQTYSVSVKSDIWKNMNENKTSPLQLSDNTIQRPFSNPCSNSQFSSIESRRKTMMGKKAYSIDQTTDEEMQKSLSNPCSTTQFVPVTLIERKTMLGKKASSFELTADDALQRHISNPSSPVYLSLTGSSKRKALIGKKASSFELTSEEAIQRHYNSLSPKTRFTPIESNPLQETSTEICTSDVDKHNNKTSARSGLPELSGPILDVLCPFPVSSQPNKKESHSENYPRPSSNNTIRNLNVENNDIQESTGMYIVEANTARSKEEHQITSQCMSGNSRNLTTQRLQDNKENLKMHLDCYSSFSLSPESSIHDFSTCEFGSSSTIPLCFTPPKINIEGPSENDICASLLSSSSAISGALEELHSDVYLTNDEWGSSLENFLTNLHDTESFLEENNMNHCSASKECGDRKILEDATFLDIPVSHCDELDKYLGPSRCSVSPMSVSPTQSSMPSPYPCGRTSRRQRRSHSASPFSSEGMDFNSIIRSSPTCLNVSTASTLEQQCDNFVSCGTYGHIVPRIELNNNEFEQSNLTFQSLLVEETHDQKYLNEPLTPTYVSNPVHLQEKYTETFDTNISSPTRLSLKSETPEKCSVYSNKMVLEEDRSESPDEIDGPRQCRWVDCNVTFPNRETLSRHIERSHIDQRKGDDFTCFWAACQRRYRPFNARYKLLIHMRVHSGEKPNKCTFKGCTKAFSRLENLKIHLRSHTGERPYICVYQNCSKAFSNSSDRAKHQRTHVDAKPYVCSVPGCKKRYTDPSSLRKHVKNHTSKEQAMAKRKNLKDDENYQRNFDSRGMGFFSSSESNSRAGLEDCNGRIFHGIVPGLRSSVQPSVPRPLTTALRGSIRGHPDPSSFSGGLGRMGEHLLSFPSPPPTPNYEAATNIHFPQFYNQSNSHGTNQTPNHSYQNHQAVSYHPVDIEQKVRLPSFESVMSNLPLKHRNEQLPFGSSNNLLNKNANDIPSASFHSQNYSILNASINDSTMQTYQQQNINNNQQAFYSLNKSQNFITNEHRYHNQPSPYSN